MFIILIQNYISAAIIRFSSALSSVQLSAPYRSALSRCTLYKGFNQLHLQTCSDVSVILQILQINHSPFCNGYSGLNVISTVGSTSFHRAKIFETLHFIHLFPSIRMLLVPGFFPATRSLVFFTFRWRFNGFQNTSNFCSNFNVQI